MGIGHLARYRRYILLLGGLLFFGGAILRWHNERQIKAVEQLSSPKGVTQVAWSDECKVYACRVIGARGSECDAICDEAVTSGDPKVAAERMASSCKKYCVAEEPGDASCPGQCLIREAMRSAAGR